MHRRPHVEKRWARKLLKRSRLVHLATATKGGTPYAVPICSAYDNEIIYTPIHEKPKRTDPGGLRRILNIEENPKVSLIADCYSEDWDKLHYVIVHGFPEVIRVGEEHARAISLLRCKYRQYLKMRLETRPIIKIKPSKVIAWSANGSAQQGMREL